jgi:ADP-ribose pyrophosphatase YjhB (NUDIX family)
MFNIFINDTTLVLSEEKPLEGVKSIHINDIVETTPISTFIFTLFSLPAHTVYIWGKEPSELLQFFSRELTNITAAGGLVQNPHGEILFIKRKGKWDLPKGKPENGESITDTAIREVEEECEIGGLSIIKPLPDTYHIYQEKDDSLVLKKSIWFQMQSIDWENPVAQTEEEITHVEWIKMPVPDYIMNGAFLSIRNLVNWFQNQYQS